MKAKWTDKDVPDQTGRIAIVTGANTGIGFEAVRVLAEKGATVIMACRNIDKGKTAVEKVKIASHLWDVSEKLTGVRY